MPVSIIYSGTATQMLTGGPQPSGDSPQPDPIVITTPGTAAIPAGVPTDRDVYLELWGSGGGGDKGLSDGIGGGGGGSAYGLWLIPREIIALGGTLTIGAKGDKGVVGGANATDGGVTKITLDSVDRCTATGGIKGRPYASPPGAAGTLVTGAGVTLLATRPGTAGADGSSDPVGSLGGSNTGPGGGVGGAGGASGQIGHDATAPGGGGGGSGFGAHNGGEGSHGQARFSWT